MTVLHWLTIEQVNALPYWLQMALIKGEYWLTDVIPGWFDSGGAWYAMLVVFLATFTRTVPTGKLGVHYRFGRVRG